MENKETKSSKNGSSKLPLIIGGMVFFFCLICACCFAVFTIGFRVLYSNVNEALEVADVLCDASDRDLERAYDNNFTEEFRDNNSLEDLQSFYSDYEDVFVCKKNFSDYGLSDMADEALEFNYSDEDGEDPNLSATFQIEDSELTINFIKDNDEWLIDGLKVR